MDLRELENYRLSDAVKFNDQLNPRLWGPDEHLLPEVRNKLRAIADDFRESLGIDVQVKDITVSGSNAAYTYTPHSDIDLHLVVDLPEADTSDVYRELFDAKKYQYNDQHDYKIGGYDVELYVQDARKPHHSQGIYSLMHDDWVRVPSRRRPEVNDISVRSKYEDIGHRVDAAIESGDLARMDVMAAKIREMRQAGLDQHGEFGPENLAFKILRGNGTLDRLRDARRQAKDQIMSLDERRKGSKKKKKTWTSCVPWHMR
jgi:predicted nucleotidyltransferase